MKILIITYGTLGDVQPYVALAKGLVHKGYQVVIATSERFRTFVEGHGLVFEHMDDALLAIIDTDQGKEMLESTTHIFDVIKQNIKIGRKVKPLQIAQLKETWEIAVKVKPDFLLFHPKTGGAPHVAEKLGIGCALVTPIPMLVPTSEWSFPVLPPVKLGGWYNRLSYTIINTLTSLFLGKYIGTFRSDIGLKPLSKFSLLKNGEGKDIPVVHMVSQAVLPLPEDWPPTAYMTGYCFLENDTRWNPPSDLIDFLDEGPAPVYVGFGSMAGRNPQQLATTVVEALQQSGVRGIVATGWGGLKLGAVPDSIFEIENAPHDWLFPRVTAVVHHGGAGTTAAGLRAGKPSVIIPFFGDQPFWGRLVHSIGVGPKPLSRKKLSAAKLAKGIDQAVSNFEIREKAEAIGQKIGQEDGINNAVKVIEKLVQEHQHR